MKHGKKYTDSAKLLETGKQYDLSEAVELVKQTAKAKFDETIELSVRLGVDPRHADQQVRGAVVLPHGTGKKSARFGILQSGQRSGSTGCRRRFHRRRRDDRQNPGRLAGL